MAVLNQALCAYNIINTGVGSCFLNIGFIRGFVSVPVDRKFTVAELADFKATLETGILSATKANRFYPVGGFTTATDSSEETVFQTMGDGTQVPVRRGRYRWMFQYQRGGMCLNNALQTHNGTNRAYIFFDDKYVAFGQRVLLDDGTYGLKGVPALLDVPNWKVNTGSEVTKYQVYFDFAGEALNLSFGFVQLDFGIDDINGLQNLVLQQTGASTAGVSKIRVLTGCDYANVYDIYSVQLASASLWRATNTATGNDITISSVVADPNVKGFTVTLSAADPDYPATSGANVTISLANPSVLDAANVSGYEGIPVTILRG
jgi:hypothetical protein